MTKLVEDNMGLVFSIANSFGNQGDSEDLIQEGSVGLIKAAEKFNPKLNNKFSTYAFYCIRNEILKYLKKNNRKPTYISHEKLDRMIEGKIHYSDRHIENEYDLTQLELKIAELRESKVSLLDICDETNLDPNTLNKHIAVIKRKMSKW